MTDDALLDEVLDAWEEGREPDPVALAARHRVGPGEIARVIRAAARYRSSIAMLQLDRAGSLRPGERVKDFEIVRFIGRGGMGEVYRARQLSLGGREVALKLLPALLQTEAGRIRFRRECELLSNLHHPSLAEVYGFGEERGLSFFAMRLIEGTDLRTIQEGLCASGASPPGTELRRTIVRWIAEVAEGLAVVHAADDRESHQPLVHRDVKPSNVIVERGTAGPDELPLGRAVLVDFGLVRPVELDTSARTEGSPATLDYASPEQLMGTDVDVRTDVFALGVTLHDLLTGRVPAERKRAAQGLELLDELVEGVDGDLVAVVARACAIDRRWRYANGAELRDDLRAWLDRRPVTARRRPILERVRRGIVEHPARILKGGLTLLVLVGGVVLAAKLGQHVQAAERTQDAFDARDLRVVLACADGLPAVLERPLLSRDAARMVARCRAADGDDALKPVLARLRVDDRSGALLAAATHLRLHGLAADPDVRWYFEGELGRAVADGGFDSSLRADALRLLARLSFERPCETPEDLAANAALRAVAVSAWRTDELPELDRLHALSALSGFGAGEDVAPVLVWTLESPHVPERLRLGLCVARWILLRIRGGCGEFAQVDFQRPTEPLGRLIEHVLATQQEDFRTGTKRNLIVHMLRNLLKEYVPAERAESGAPSRLVRVVPADWIRDLEHRESNDSLPGWFLSLCGDQRVRDLLLEGPWLRGAQASHYKNWGSLATLAGDDEYVARVRLRCQQLASNEPSSTELLAAFDGAAAAERAAATGGIPPGWKPDPDTLLGAADTSLGESSPITTERSSEELREPILAAWSFASLPATIAGWSTGAATRRAAPGWDERQRSYLRFSGFGSSEVELYFHVNSSVAPLSSPVLVLEHVAARRDPYPGHGIVFLDVILNGFVVSSRMTVVQHDIDEDIAPMQVAIPLYMLQRGDNVLLLRLHRDSMSTYRLHGAELRSQ